MGRGITRTTISQRAPRKGQRMSQADRRAYREATRQWYDSQIKGLEARIKNPRLSSEMSMTEINQLVANNRSFAASQGQRPNSGLAEIQVTANINMRNFGRTGVRHGQNYMTARRAVERGKWNEQIANLQNSNRRGLSPGQAQARLTRLRNAQAQGTTRYTAGRGKYRYSETVPGGVVNQRFAPKSGTTKRTTPKDIARREAANARTAKTFQQRQADPQITSAQRQVEVAIRRHDQVRRINKAREATMNTPQARRAREAAQSVDPTLRASQLNYQRQLRHSGRAEGWNLPAQGPTYQGRPIGRRPSTGYGTSFSGRGTGRRPGRPRQEGRRLLPPSRRSGRERFHNRLTGRARTREQIRSDQRYASQMRQVARSPMTRQERRHFGNRRPDPDTLYEYRQAQREIRRQAAFDAARSARARANAARRRSDRIYMDNLRREGFEIDVPLPETRRPGRRRRRRRSN